MFHFKQFSIEDSGATMKVGTDAILLGALATPYQQPTRILDIGTGCGIIALMMAQRFPNAAIDAIDIDTSSISVATENILHSPWPDRLHCHNTSLQNHIHKADNPYNLIISNPPYFSNSLRNNNPQKRLARHDDTLPPTMLFECSNHILCDNGEIWIIIPSTEKKRFTFAAQSANLYLTETIDICTNPHKTPKLTVLSFAKENPKTTKESQFSIHDEQNQYTNWYRNLCFPFLL